MQIELEELEGTYSVLKYETCPSLPKEGFSCLAQSEREISLVSESKHAPPSPTQREDGFKGLRVKGSLEFSLVGILSRLTGALADSGISVFAISTFDTDYLFVKEERLEEAKSALSNVSVS